MSAKRKERPVCEWILSPRPDRKPAHCRRGATWSFADNGRECFYCTTHHATFLASDPREASDPRWSRIKTKP